MSEDQLYRMAEMRQRIHDLESQLASLDRLRALAKEAMRAKYESRVYGMASQGHIGEMETCPHPDCVLVRAGEGGAMSEKKAINDSTIARIAGNIAAGFVGRKPEQEDHAQWITDVVAWSVCLARKIAAEVERTSLSAG